MDSLVLLCARRVVAQSPIPVLPADLYPVLFETAFLEGRPQVLQVLVAAWPFPELHFLRLLRYRELVRIPHCKPCIKAVIQGVVLQLQRELEEPSSDSSRCQLRVLDMTGLLDYPFRVRFWSSTKALAQACVEVSKHQQELQRHGSKRHKGCSGAATAAPQLLGVDVHTDLLVKRSSYKILRDALQTGATSPLRLKCREFKAQNISGSQIVTLLESLDPSCLRRVHLPSISFGLLSVIIPHLSRFPQFRSLMIPFYNSHVQCLTPKSAMKIPCVARQLGNLPGLRELSLGMIELSGNLQQFLCDFQTPLESLELPYCSLFPADLAFLSQTFHAPALKKLDLRGHDISEGFLEPLRLLLEKASASLLHLDLSSCNMADSHLAVLLPTLLRCSRLRFLRLYNNPLSMATLKDLLQKTLELPDLHQVVYPYPVDLQSLEPQDFTYEERLATAEAEFSQILVNSGRTDFIWNSDLFGNRGLDYFSL